MYNKKELNIDLMLDILTDNEESKHWVFGVTYFTDLESRYPIPDKHFTRICAFTGFAVKSKINQNNDITIVNKAGWVSALKREQK